MKSSLAKVGLFVLLGLCVNHGTRAANPAASVIALAGEWRFALDRGDVGVNEQWFGKHLTNQITLPGCLQAQGYGDEISTNTPWVLSLYDRFWFLRQDYQAYTKPGNVKVPFLCQPPRHYLGAAWYQREIEIPPDWPGRRVVLHLERPHWESTVWVDDQKAGSCRSLCTPHLYDLGMLKPGKHQLSIRVDNRMILNYRPDTHSVSDSLGSSWNGIVGKIELSATTPVWIDDARVFSNVPKKSALIKIQIGNRTGQSGTGMLSAASATAPVTWATNGGQAEFEVPLGNDAPLWDEFNPVLQRLTVQLKGPQADDRRELVFGLREFRAQGQELVMNGRNIHLRGTHNGGDFPLTGYPPTDIESWKKIFSACHEWGLNHMRFHSWCPPEAAFVAADELGFYLQPECGMWNEISPGSAIEQMMYEETERMIRAYGNHPSFVLLSPSNEPSGRWQQSLPKWVSYFRREDPRRLYTTGTGWSLINTPGPVEGADFLAVHRIGSNMLRGVSAWFGRDYSRSLRGVNVPVVSHELGQWCAYPDYDIIKKFTGYLQPGNYEIFRDSLAAHGLSDQNKHFAWASGRFQLACYKEEIEANLRTPGLSGFQLLDLHDYVGQGTALVGLLDAFWEPKGYATSEEFRRFCNPTVPLARLRTRVFTTSDPFDVDVEIAHYGAAPITNATPAWTMVDAAGKVAAQGQWPARTIPIGKNITLGKVNVDLSRLPAPRAYRLIVRIGQTSHSSPAGQVTGHIGENDWNIWLYPAPGDNTAPQDVTITRSWDEAENRLAAGGKVLFVPRAVDLDWTSPPLDNIPVFWNRLMGPGWSRMLGLWCDTNHPALAGFPTEPNCDWQWTEIVRRVCAVNVDRLPRRLQPIVQAIDDWNRNYKLAVVFECQVGPGRLIVCAADLVSALDSQPVARQLRRSLLDYMASAQFQPPVAISAPEMRGLLFDRRIMRRLGAVIQAAGSGSATEAIDGDPNTYWLAGFTGRRPRQPDAAAQALRQPHVLTISFPAPIPMSGLVCMPRQNERGHEGDIRDYEIQASDDGQKWREVMRGELVSTFHPQQVRFPQVITARQLKFTALSGFGSDTTAALAELAVVYAGPKLADDGTGTTEYQRVRSESTDIDEGTAIPKAPTNTPPQPKP
jgi:hypothetical protein